MLDEGNRPKSQLYENTVIQHSNHAPSAPAVQSIKHGHKDNFNFTATKHASLEENWEKHPRVSLTRVKGSLR